MKKVSDLKIPFPWEERRPVLLERCLYIPGYFATHDRWDPLPWSNEHLFGNDQPVAIEYCSGNGQWICQEAKRHPTWNWVAVEKRFDRARKIWARLHRESIPNLFVVCGEAVTFTRFYVPSQSVFQVFINFPDPWPKLRHAKHRLVRKDFFDSLERILIRPATATLVTDDLPYAKEMVNTLTHSPNWHPRFPSPHYLTDWPDYGNSYFCNLWKSQGRTIHYLQYEVRA